MRVKAMFTIEAAYVVPAFTIIVAVLINFMILLHDKAVFNSVDIKMQMRAEFEGGEAGYYEQRADEYLNNRLIFYYSQVDVENGQLIKENNMVRFARITKAITSINGEEVKE